MKAFVLAAFICIISTVIYGQPRFIKWQENQQLQWEDFAGPVVDTSKYDAECFAEIRYHYKFYSPSDFRFDVYAHFDKNNSWRRKEMESEALLRHEQLHFNIAKLFVEKLKDEFNNFRYSWNYENEILQLFNGKKKEYHLMQLQYDEETDHSLHREKQKEWEDFIEEELRKTKLNLQLVQSNEIDMEEGG